MTSPVLIEPRELETRLNEVDLQVVDLCKAEQYARGHIPGAVHLDYSRLVMSRPPVTGLLPSLEYLRELFSTLGLKRDVCV
ncbi:MAG: rhodanese-like domain-containing protein, partial [Pseudomonadota bacterium]|nr:rhodanese-like domain-containing protein [Pseudomonadota bacterium]